MSAKNLGYIKVRSPYLHQIRFGHHQDNTLLSLLNPNDPNTSVGGQEKLPGIQVVLGNLNRSHPITRERNDTREQKVSNQNSFKTVEKPAASDSKVCQICDKVFSTVYSQRRHMQQVHLGEKKFQCNICERRFAQKLYMVEHMSIHYDVEPY